MNNNKIKNRNIISRFSSSLLGRGKKAEGYKTFFNLLLFLKVNTDRKLLNLNLQQKELKTNTSFVYFLHSIGFHEKALLSFFPKNDKAFQNIAKIYSQSSSNDSLDNDSYTSQKVTHSLKKGGLKESPRKWNKSSVNDKKRQNVIGFASGNSPAKAKPEEIAPSIISAQAFPSKTLCKISIDNVKPILETRKVRKGRMTYRIPLVTRTERQEGKAISWLIEGANSRKNKVKKGQSPSLTVGDGRKPTDIASNLSSKTKTKSSSLAFAELLPKAKSITPYDTHNMLKSEKSVSPNLKTFDWRSTIVEDRRKNYRSLQYCLADSLLEASQGKGESVEKRKEYHQLALQNRAYTHYRWW